MAGELSGFLFELGVLKRYPRSGWLVAGVADPESVADHSFRTAILASVLAVQEGADPERAALLGLFHDTQEARLTDLHHLAQRYATRAPNEQVTADQVRGLPEPVAKMISRVVGEYEGGESSEAVCARDADALECLIQAVEYREQGNRNMQPFIDTALPRLRTPSARRLAEEVLATGTVAWAERALD
ncbi:HAD family hydrolase [Actinomadura craniellae]|uniref:5'-deoxynucleotidase n=1 Tax=Actinomadura craniellae TaxID=2231787 RepID=A0A365H9R2_9ACTN|nr:HD domain-containing protein [Actinomadura craniellae]RAY15676.1 HAD family hydrolase [Actinomadura craniellae]